MTISDDDIDKILSSTPEQNLEDKGKLLEPHIAERMKFFDTVQILCTKYVASERTTEYYSRGMGNSFARLGYLRIHLKSEEQNMTKSMGGDDGL